MSMNYYIERKEPRMVPEYDRTHVAKLSTGWMAHFDGSSAWSSPFASSDGNKPHFGNMDELRRLLDTGEWELVDEYGGKATLEEILAHDYVTRDGELVNTQVSLNDYYDADNYAWSRNPFE